MPRHPRSEPRRRYESSVCGDGGHLLPSASWLTRNPVRGGRWHGDNTLRQANAQERLYDAGDPGMMRSWPLSSRRPEEALTVCASFSDWNVVHIGLAQAHDLFTHRTSRIAHISAVHLPGRRQSRLDRKVTVSLEAHLTCRGCDYSMGGLHKYRGRYPSARYATTTGLGRAGPQRSHSAYKWSAKVAFGAKGSPQESSRRARPANTRQPLYEPQGVGHTSKLMRARMGSTTLVQEALSIQVPKIPKDHDE